eukprot:4958374-Ditylum_brightwellii.AAC.1
MVQRNPQAVHTSFCRSLQHEEAYIQRVIEVDSEKYAVLDSIIKSELIPALFNMDANPAKFDQLFIMPVKEASLGILSPTDDDWTMNKGQWEGKKCTSERYEKIFSEVCVPLSPDLVQGLEERS